MGKKPLKQASKAAIYRDKVKQLDNIGSDSSEFLQGASLSVIEGILGDFILRVQKNINKEKDMVVTGRISDIELQSTEDSIDVIGNSWLIYQDRGVNGSERKRYDTPHKYTDKMPPVQVFREWIKRKNINLQNSRSLGFEERSDFEGMEEKEINKLAWAMAKSVYKKGFKPRRIYSKEIPKLVEQLQKEITDFAIQYINQRINVKPEAKRIIPK